MKNPHLNIELGTSILGASDKVMLIMTLNSHSILPVPFQRLVWHIYLPWQEMWIQSVKAKIVTLLAKLRNSLAVQCVFAGPIPFLSRAAGEEYFHTGIDDIPHKMNVLENLSLPPWHGRSRDYSMYCLILMRRDIQDSLSNTNFCIVFLFEGLTVSNLTQHIQE